MFYVHGPQYLKSTCNVNKYLNTLGELQLNVNNNRKIKRYTDSSPYSQAIGKLL